MVISKIIFYCDDDGDVWVSQATGSQLGIDHAACLGGQLKCVKSLVDSWEIPNM